ncbi:1-acyl-sn-glycerol-3-phosphate acyltransferase [Myxococcota bacterium]|nr:1-acyl-sn-glycerol-3-phosphate acyltransferase [Myxococcota bacterium]
MPVPPVPRPTAAQLEPLSSLERRCFAAADLFMRRLRWWSVLWNSTFMVVLTWLATGRRMRVQGLEHVADLGPTDRVLLVANHRSFFDFFQVMAVAFARLHLGRRLIFPVRSTFFYDHPLGPLVNFLMSGMSMFPPILRSRAGVRFNEYALDRCVAELQAPGTVVGIHPEGTRNKGPDPYTLLRVTRGVGRVALQAGPGVRVVPIFVLGGENNLAEEVRRNFLEPARYPLDVMFGPAVELSDLSGRGEDAAAWKEAARRCVAGIEALAEEHRRRYAAEAGPSEQGA